MCLDGDGGDPRSGMLVHTWDCGSTNDHWKFDSAGHLIDDAGGAGFCLSLVNGVGPAVEMHECDSATTWELWWYEHSFGCNATLPNLSTCVSIIVAGTNSARYSTPPNSLVSSNVHTFRIHSTTVPALCLFGPDGSTTGQVSPTRKHSCAFHTRNPLSVRVAHRLDPSLGLNCTVLFLLVYLGEYSKSSTQLCRAAMLRRLKSPDSSSASEIVMQELEMAPTGASPEAAESQQSSNPLSGDTLTIS